MTKSILTLHYPFGEGRFYELRRVKDGRGRNPIYQNELNSCRIFRTADYLDFQLCGA